MKRTALPPDDIPHEIILKTCPFCGEHAATIVESGQFPANPFYVLCDCCLSSIDSFRSPEEAARAWNKRVCAEDKNRRRSDGAGSVK